MSESKKVIKKLLPEEYAKAKTMWASGRYTLSDISSQFGVSVQAMQKRFTKDGVKKGMDADRHAKAVQQAMEDSLINEREETARLIRDEKETTLKMIDQLRKRALFEIAKTSKENLPLAAADANLKVIERAVKVVLMAYDGSARILRIDQIADGDAEVPVFRIEGMTDDEVEQIRQAQSQQMRELIEGDIDEILDDEEIEIVGDEPESQLDDRDEAFFEQGDMA